MAYRIPKSHRRAVVVVLFAICLPVMLILAAFCINVAYMELTRTELQIATDVAARAAGRRLVLSGKNTDAIKEGVDAAARNVVSGTPLSLVKGDFEFGVSTRNSLSSRYAFVSTEGQANSVRITGRKTAGSASGKAQLFFGNFTNIVDFEPVQRSISTQVELDIAIVLDRSGSMAYGINESTPTDSYFPPASAPEGWEFGDTAPPDCRWRDTLAAFDAFLQELNTTPQDEKVAMVTYSEASNVDLDFTTNYADTQAALDSYTQSYATGSTNIAAGIASATNALANSSNSRQWSAKVIVVLTDGHATAGSDPAFEATSAAEQGITVYTVTFSNEADQFNMAQVASNGAGLHFHADSPDDLVAAFQEIVKNLPTLVTE